MFDFDLPFINEQFYSSSQTAAEMDELCNEGWRHFGTHFFRYSLGIYRDEIQRIIPLRIRLADFKPSESQRRVLRKNADLQTLIRPATVTKEKQELFERHKVRFDHAIPDSIYDFVSAYPSEIPSVTNEVCIFDGERLLSVSFLGMGETTTSAIYAMFEPAESARSLGIQMILKEAEYSLEQGMEYLHLGYAYDGPSFYDYKKRFGALEQFDWMGNWIDFVG